MVVSQIRKTPNTILHLIFGNPKMTPLIIGDPHVVFEASVGSERLAAPPRPSKSRPPERARPAAALAVQG